MSNNINQKRQSAKSSVRLVLPKQTRLRDAFTPLMEAAGLEFSRNSGRQAFGTLSDNENTLTGCETTMKKPNDALRKLQEQRADMAIVGVDKYIEAQSRAIESGAPLKLRIAAAFNCAACEMYVAAPADTKIESPQDLQNMNIATSYPFSLRRWLLVNGVDPDRVNIITCEGDTEDETRDGTADAIFEIVDSGRSLIENNLVKKIRAYSVQAVLIERTGTWNPQSRTQADNLRSRLQQASASLYGLKEDEQKILPPQKIRKSKTLFYPGF